MFEFLSLLITILAILVMPKDVDAWLQIMILSLIIMGSVLSVILVRRPLMRLVITFLTFFATAAFLFTDYVENQLVGMSRTQYSAVQFIMAGIAMVEFFHVFYEIYMIQQEQQEAEFPFGNLSPKDFGWNFLYSEIPKVSKVSPSVVSLPKSICASSPLSATKSLIDKFVTPSNIDKIKRLIGYLVCVKDQENICDPEDVAEKLTFKDNKELFEWLEGFWNGLSSCEQEKLKLLLPTQVQVDKLTWTTGIAFGAALLVVPQTASTIRQTFARVLQDPKFLNKLMTDLRNYILV